MQGCSSEKKASATEGFATYLDDRWILSTQTDEEREREDERMASDGLDGSPSGDRDRVTLADRRRAGPDWTLEGG